MFPGLDDPAVVRLFAERELPLEVFAQLVDPTIEREVAAKQARMIGIVTFDQGCCGPENPPVIRALLAALTHPTCRAPATLLRLLGNYLFDNAQQDPALGPRDEVYEGFDTRDRRWAAFRGHEYAFLRDMHSALSEGVPTYLESLSHAEADVREAAAFALAPNYPEHDLRAALAKKLQTEEDEFALAAIILTVSLHAKYAGEVPDVAAFVDDERLAVSVAAAIALANHGAESSAIRDALKRGSRSSQLVFARGERGISLGPRNLRLAATRALARSSRGLEMLVDNTVVAKDTFLDVTVARIAAEALLATVDLPDKISDVSPEARAVLEAIAQHPGSVSREVGRQVGAPTQLARDLGLRPNSRLVGGLADRVVATLTSGNDLTPLAEELVTTGRDEELLDLVDDLLGHSFRTDRMAFEWPQERPRDVVVKVRAEGARRDARTVLLGTLILERGRIDVGALHRRAAEATGDRLGIHRPLCAFLLCLITRGERLPEHCARVLKHAAHVPELVPSVRRFLQDLPACDRLAPVTGWDDTATCFYGDLLDAEGLLKLARSYNYRLDETHAVPFLSSLANDNPPLYAQVIAALVKRQDPERLARLPGATKRTLQTEHGTVELWGQPTPSPVNRLSPLWP